MIEPYVIMLTGAAIVSIYMAGLWLWQRSRGEADIVDLGWTLSIGFLAALFCTFGSSDLIARSAVCIFAGLWSLRLGSHLLFTRVRKAGEDGRYVALRESWKENAQRNFFIFFQAQALLAVLFSLEFLYLANASISISLRQILCAALVFLLSVGGEGLADRQLDRWRSNPANHGKTCRTGLWRFSRHPNYFFEWLYWSVYTILGIHTHYWWITLLNPVLLLYLILKVTGIPPTEERALKSRGDDYREYQRTTSAFFPWFPKGG